MRQYEGMFIFDPTFATDFKNVEGEVERVMKRADAEIIVSRKWDERKLAYDINKCKRGCYVLTYFRAEPERIVALERDCTLSEKILRVLVLRVDDMSRERMDAMYPQKAAAAIPAESGTASEEKVAKPVAVAQASEETAPPAGTEADAPPTDVADAAGRDAPVSPVSADAEAEADA